MQEPQSLTRKEIWPALDEPFDVVIIGGGITGAGVFWSSASRGYRTLLLEQSDFAWGTSSRSSKLVHGGLRYLRQGKLCLTRESLHEREWLLRESNGLVTELPLLLPCYSQSMAPSRPALHAGLALYDLLAKRWNHGYLSRASTLSRLAILKQNDLKGGFWFSDAQTDDARLVLSVIQSGKRLGGLAQNYAKVTEVKKGAKGNWHIFVTDQVSGRPRHCEEGEARRSNPESPPGLPRPLTRPRNDGLAEHLPSGQTYALESKVVVNATGVWANELPVFAKEPLRSLPCLRPLRGSHLVFPSHRLPVREGVMLFHPQDGRPVFVLPWEGATIVGTTDLDHDQDLSEEPVITSHEVDYLFLLLEEFFPRLNLTPKDLLSVYSGIRPVISSGKRDPSSESREAKIVHVDGYVVVAGGKLTTFRSMANQVMKFVDCYLGRRLRAGVVEHSWFEKELETPTLWAEVLQGAKHEAVVHLDDLLLRRTRIGLLVSRGGQDLLPRIRTLCQPVLGWDDATWEQEEKRYVEIWKRSYSLSANTL